MSRMCNKCLHYYEDDLDKCPYCNPSMDTYKNIKKTNIDLDININEINNLKNEVSNNKKNIIFEEEKKPALKNEEKKKKKEEDHTFSIIFFVLSFIIMFTSVLYNVNEFDVLLFSHYLVTSLLLIVAFVLSLRSVVGYYIAVVASFLMILMIIEEDYTNFSVGIVIFLSIFTYLIIKSRTKEGLK